MILAGRSYLSASIEILRKDGVRRFLGLALGALWARLFQTSAADWYCCQLTEAGVDQPRPPGAEIDFASPDVLEWLRTLQPDFDWAWIEPEIGTASRNEHIFPLVRIDGVNAGYIKVGLAKVFVTDFKRELSIPSGDAFIYDAFVHPEFRGQGVARWARAETMRWLHGQGIDCVWSHIPRWNRSAIAMVKSCGCRRITFIRHVRWLRWHLYSQDPERLMAKGCGAGRDQVR